MRHDPPPAPQFYVTAPQPCPYLPDRRERKLFTALKGMNALQLSNALSKQGFRRSQNVLYRPSCTECAACLSVRVRVADFAPRRSHNRTLRRNRAVERAVVAPWATEEQFRLFRAYLKNRHAAGGMTNMDLLEFAAMVEDSTVSTCVIEYRTADATRLNGEDARAPERLIAGCLSDILDDGLSMVYSFFDPDLRHLSLGQYMILDHIALAREMGLEYVYLGYWVPKSDKMAYKASYRPMEVFFDGEWRELADPSDYSNTLDPLSTEPIVEQVAKITASGWNITK